MSVLPQSSDPHSARLTSLIEAVQPRLRAFLISLTANRAEVDDLLQETNIVIWDKRAEFRPDGNFHAWAFQIGYFQARNHLRRRARQAQFEVPGDDLLEKIADASTTLVEQTEPRRRALAACLAKLKPADRDLVMRRYISGLDLAILSAETGSNPNALSQRLFRLRQTLLLCIRTELDHRFAPPSSL